MFAFPLSYARHFGSPGSKWDPAAGAYSTAETEGIYNISISGSAAAACVVGAPICVVLCVVA